jgi:AraC-like DNA-binding protein
MASPNETRIMIRNMVCQRCIMSVQELLKQLNIPYSDVLLGEVITGELPQDKREQLATGLKKLGFELIENRINKLVEKIKKHVLSYLNGISDHRLKLSTHITQHLHYDYSYLSDIFSSIEGVTIEQFFILQRIEKVKELLVYEELSLADIAWETGFSSTAHLSAQFKKVTGLTPSHFKKIGAAKRKAIDGI